MVKTRIFPPSACPMDLSHGFAKAMHISTDFLLFEEHERGPSDDIALQFEAVSQLPPDELKVVQEVLESLIIKYQARRWDSARDQQAAAK